MKKHTFSRHAIFIFSLLISACASNHPTINVTDISPTSDIKKALYAQHAEWKSVKYRWGGLSKSGIDCSGFVNRTFAEKFNLQLPRTTQQQINSGTPIYKQSKLKPGDLVFFKTGIYQRHVGIYLEQRRFLHVSTSKGVILSHLDNPYWRKKYWKAIRVLASH